MNLYIKRWDPRFYCKLTWGSVTLLANCQDWDFFFVGLLVWRGISTWHLCKPLFGEEVWLLIVLCLCSRRLKASELERFLQSSSPVVAAGFSSLVYPTWFILISNGNHTKTILISNIYLNSVSKLHKNLSGGLEECLAQLFCPRLW